MSQEEMQRKCKEVCRQFEICNEFFQRGYEITDSHHIHRIISRMDDVIDGAINYFHQKNYFVAFMLVIAQMTEMCREFADEMGVSYDEYYDLAEKLIPRLIAVSKQYEDDAEFNDMFKRMMGGDDARKNDAEWRFREPRAEDDEVDAQP